jgi:NADPH2:quinone reductase
MADELFDMLASGKIKVDNIQQFALKDAGKAQIELSGRRTTGSSILIP